ncbi:MAG: co-chaperone YbbN [Caulobacteraceae bacterium]
MSLIGEGGPLTGSAAAPPPADLIKDGTDASFMADVVEASKTQPVIVDFWATWCGPCKTLGPMLERAVAAAGGAVKMVKIDIDKNPGYAGQLRVQSIPTVYAFSGGRPVDAFQGAVPESEVKAFVGRLAKSAGGSPVDQLLDIAKEALEADDHNTAAQAYSQILQAEPDNVAAIGGMAKLYHANGDLDRAREFAGMAPADAKNPDLESVRAALALADAGSSETAPLEQKVAANPEDHEARFELAGALAGQGKLQEAADHLLTIIEKDREWNEEAARKQLLTVFEAAGMGSDLAKQGRRRLSAILFS